MENGSNIGIRCNLSEVVMAYDYSIPPPGYHFYENKPSAYDYSTPTPGYATYDFKRNDATSPSGKYPYPYTTKGQKANVPSRRGHTRQASYSSLASLNPDSIRPKFQGTDLSTEGAYDEGYEKDFEVTNNPFAFSPGQLNEILSPKSMALYRDSSAAAYSVKEPSPSIIEPNYASDSPYPFSRSYKLDRTMSDIHQDELLYPSMQDVPKAISPISPKDALLEDLDALLEDLNDAEEGEVSAVNAGNILHKDKNDDQTEKVKQMRRSKGVGDFLRWSKSEGQASGPDPKQQTSYQTPVRSNVERPFPHKVSPGSPRPVTFKRQEGEKRERLIPVESPSRVGSFQRTKQGLVGFANGSSIAAMADTGSRKNVISASYAMKLDLSIEGLPSTFAIGNSRKIQSLGKYTHCLMRSFKY